MPYIPVEEKMKYEPMLFRLRALINEKTPKGDLTYLVYALGLGFFKGRESYTRISAAISCLQDAAEELRRRYLNPYEDERIKENGDVL
ncbi:hypothetical protein HYT23_05440 [Candidatus Pacearchaeota archaeon]|nr:hypothetical protein [Candidatus Pacearchaeota archaeon]